MLFRNGEKAGLAGALPFVVLMGRGGTCGVAGIPGRKGEKVLKIDGAFAPRVRRFDTAYGCEGCGGALSGAI